MDNRRYLITQSLVAAWGYMFDCHEGCEEQARADFIRTLKREPGEPSEAMLNGRAFEDAVYFAAAGEPREPHRKWESGIRQVAKIIQGAPVQVKVSRELFVAGERFLVYGILDALKAGVIYDVKFSSRSLGGSEGFHAYGKYLESPQHPFYLFMVPEAYEFQYLLSDGADLYIERYARADVRPAAEIIAEFISSLRDMGLMELYKEKWVAK